MATDRGGIPPTTLQHIRDTVDIVEIISRYVTLSKSGKNYRGLCPFHSEKTPSFNVNPERQMYYCFGCGAGGDVFSFLMNRERLTFVEAVKELAHQAGIDIPVSSVGRSSGDEGNTRKTLEHLHALANSWFQQNLYDSPQGREALSYLSGRGLSVDLLKEFGVGYALPSWDALTQFLLRQGADPVEIVQAGLAISKESRPEKRSGLYDRFRSRIMIPIMDLRGRVIAFGGRVLEDTDMPKYLNSPETALFNKRRCLFGLDRARDALPSLTSLLVVEGYFDVLVLHQYGIRHAVAPLGTALTSEHVTLLRRFVKKVVLMFDGDTAGKKATLRTLDLFLNSGIAVNVIQLPVGEDPDSFVRTYGTQQLMALEKEARPLLEFAVAQRLEGAQHASVEERMRRVEEILAILAKVENPIEKEEYLKLVAERLGIRLSLLLRRLPSLSKGPRNQEAVQPSKRIPLPGHKPDRKGSREEYELIVLLVQGMLDPEYLFALRESDFQVPEYRRLLEMSRASVTNDSHLNMEQFLAQAGEDPELGPLVAKLSVIEQHFDDRREYIEGCLKALTRKRLRATLDQLIARLRLAERENRTDEVERLNAEIESLREQKAGFAVTSHL